jgi:hypothetical protein
MFAEQQVASGDGTLETRLANVVYRDPAASNFAC